MRAIQIAGAIVLLALCFASGLYGAPLARTAYQRWFPEPAYRSGNYAQLHADAHSDVVLFSTSECPYCKQARALLTERGVPFTDYVIDKSAEAEKRFAAAGGVAVPLLYIGNRRIRGFSAATISDALAALPESGPPAPKG